MSVCEIWVTGWSFFFFCGVWCGGWTVTLSPLCCHVLWNMLAAFVSLWLVLLFWQFHTMVPSCTVMLSSPSQYECWNLGLHGSILTWDTWIAQPWDTASARSEEDSKEEPNIRWFLSFFGFSIWILCVQWSLKGWGNTESLEIQIYFKTD